MIDILKAKFTLLLHTKLTYAMISLHLIFLLTTTYSTGDGAIGLISILNQSIYQWMIFIPIMILIQKESVFTVSYNYISRFTRMKKIILGDMVMLMISTGFLSLAMLWIPIGVITLIEGVGAISLNLTLFVFFRYYFLSIFIQILIYFIMLHMPLLQKNTNYICLLPILLFFVFTLPQEWLYANGLDFIPALDFKPNIIWSMNKDFLSYIICNLHLIGYTFVLVWVQIDMGIKRLELFDHGYDMETA